MANKPRLSGFTKDRFPFLLHGVRGAVSVEQRPVAKKRNRGASIAWHKAGNVPPLPLSPSHSISRPTTGSTWRLFSMLPFGGALIGLMRSPGSLWTSPSGKLATVLQFASIQEKCPPLCSPNSACFDLALEWYTVVNQTRTDTERLCTG